MVSKPSHHEIAVRNLLGSKCVPGSPEGRTETKKKQIIIIIIVKKAVEDRRGTFTPFVLSVDGLLQKEASHFLRHMAAALSFKWDKAFSVTSSYVRSQLAFAGVRAVSLCLRGPASNGEVGWGLMMVLLWPHLWIKFFDYLFLFMISF